MKFIATIFAALFCLCNANAQFVKAKEDITKRSVLDIGLSNLMYTSNELNMQPGIKLNSGGNRRDKRIRGGFNLLFALPTKLSGVFKNNIALGGGYTKYKYMHPGIFQAGLKMYGFIRNENESSGTNWQPFISVGSSFMSPFQNSSNYSESENLATYSGAFTESKKEPGENVFVNLSTGTTFEFGKAYFARFEVGYNISALALRTTYIEPSTINYNSISVSFSIGIIYSTMRIK